MWILLEFFSTEIQLLLLLLSSSFYLNETRHVNLNKWRHINQTDILPSYILTLLCVFVVIKLFHVRAIIAFYILCEKYRVRNTEFFLNRDRWPKISKFSNLSRFSKELGFEKGLGTSLSHSLNPNASNCIERSQIQNHHSSNSFCHISFGLTIFRVSFCACDKFHIDSVSFLVHILMFECVRFKWRNKPVVFAYLVLNSW